MQTRHLVPGLDWQDLPAAPLTRMRAQGSPVEKSVRFCVICMWRWAWGSGGHGGQVGQEVRWAGGPGGPDQAGQRVRWARVSGGRGGQVGYRVRWARGSGGLEGQVASCIYVHLTAFFCTSLHFSAHHCISLHHTAFICTSLYYSAPHFISSSTP